MSDQNRPVYNSIEALQQSLVSAHLHNIDGQVYRASQAQSRFLAYRRTGLSHMAQIIAGEVPGIVAFTPGKQPVMDSRLLDEFARGSLSACLGPDYAIYEGRRVPRIPNGDLMLMSRVIDLQGTPRDFKQAATVVTEFDVPSDVWFLKDNAYPVVPYSVWMEMALQPCGILSAWMGSMLSEPGIEYYFRNLDGWTELVSDPDVSGRTITARAELMSSVSTGDTIIQKYAFELSCSGVTIYRGESSFGYFSPQAMSRQLGLDAGRNSRPDASSTRGDLLDIRRYMQPGTVRSYFRLPGGKLALLNQVAVTKEGGRYGNGYVYARKEINPSDWFYNCHFFMDPVMPGSLGVEAIHQALQVYAIETGLGSRFTSPRFGLNTGQRMQWKYRGQITPAHHVMELEAHIAGIEQVDNQVIVRAEASLWVDNIRIYEVKQAAISLLEG
jgi:3-hydroxymyristoyl/3-hydroxydecanoyl-(acyl carrier protein) dehydratase